MIVQEHDKRAHLETSGYLQAMGHVLKWNYCDVTTIAPEDDKQP